MAIMNPYKTEMQAEKTDIVNKKQKMSVLLKQKGNQKSTPGLYVTAFDITQSDWDKSNDFTTLMQDYTNMRNGDSFVSSSVDVLMNPILNSNIKVNCGKLDDETEETPLAEEAKKYVEYTFQNLFNGLSYYHRHLTLAFYYGCSFFETVWVKGDIINGKITNRLAKLSPIQTDTIQRWYYDELEEFIGIRIYKRLPNRGTMPVDISAEKIHRFTPFEEFNNVQGRSILRPIRFTWNIKQQVLKSSARSASRGAGIPVATIAENVSDENSVLANKIQTVIQTIGNSENTGVVDQEGVWKFRLEGLQNQGDNMNLLNFCNSDIVYNTLTQFLISGIGGNGSRSATDSHKAPYIEALACYVKQIENNYNQLIELIIDNSYLYGKLDVFEYPYVTLDISKDVDLTQTADNYIKLVQATGIKPSREDEKYLRSVFNLPEIEIEDEIEESENEMPEQETPETEIDTKTKSEDIPEEIKAPEISEETLMKLSNLKKTIKYKGVKHPGIKIIDEKEQGIKDTIDSYYKMMLESAKLQLNQNSKNPVKIPQIMKDELYKAINSIYNELWDIGYKHESEAIKTVDSSVKLAKPTGPLAVSPNRKKLEFVVNLLGDVMENQINTALLNSNPTKIKNAGGINQFVDDTFGDSQKVIKGTILNNVLSGYVEGITDSQDAYEIESGNEVLKSYTVQLERQNVCEVCFPYEGMVFSKADAEDLGLNWTGTPLNPECLGLLGKNQCRCTWQIEQIAMTDVGY